MSLLLALVACLPACRLGFDETARGHAHDAPSTGGDAPLLTVGPGQVGCIYSITVGGAGGGRGNHDLPSSNADGGSGGRIVFEFVPATTGAGAIATGTLDDPGPGAGGGGSTEIAFASGATTPTLAIAGGGGSGGYARALMAEYAATGLPAAFVPKDATGSDHNAPLEDS